MPTQYDKIPPQFANQPVILVHLRAHRDSDIAWCAPIRYRQDTGAYPNTPRVMCPACAKAGTR